MRWLERIWLDSEVISVTLYYPFAAPYVVQKFHFLSVYSFWGWTKSYLIGCLTTGWTIWRAWILSSYVDGFLSYISLCCEGVWGSSEDDVLVFQTSKFPIHPCFHLSLSWIRVSLFYIHLFFYFILSLYFSWSSQHNIQLLDKYDFFLLWPYGKMTPDNVGLHHKMRTHSSLSEYTLQI